MSDRKIHAESRPPKQRDYESQLKEKGGKRLPGGSLQPDAAAALDALVQAGYAGSATAVIARALIDAHDWLAGGKTEQPTKPQTKA